MLLERLQENGAMAADTAKCIAKLLSVSMLHDEHITRFRAGVVTRQSEIAKIRDQLTGRDRTEAVDRMIDVAGQIEHLWDEIAAKLDKSKFKKAA